MAKVPSLLVNAVTTFDGKALAKGQKSVTSFAKTAAKSLGLAFGTASVIAFGKASVKAFAENEKSAKRLESVLKNIGLSFDTGMIENRLGEISAKFGYEGEVLREAFQKLVTVTGDTTKAQNLLNLSLDVAAGSGEDLLTVNQDLAAVYVGNTKGLRKYNLGLTQSELKTLDVNDAVTLLTKTFAGAGAAELETYSGKMRVLKEAAGNASEIIGKGLVDALSGLGEDDSVAKLASNMEKAALSTADVIRGIGVLAEKLKRIPGFDTKDWEYVYNISYLKFIKDLGAADRIKPKPFTTPLTISGSTDTQGKIDRDRAKAAAEAARREKERLALLKKQEISEKNKLSLSKAGAVFDTTRISLNAALKATYDKETKLRLEALIAIEEENGDEALRKISQLASFQKNADLDKLAGIKQISDVTLAAINGQLLTELMAINKSKMAEGDKELAREEAFKKYNAAIVAAGQLAAKEQYSERTQIQLTEIARLAALSNTTSAQKTEVLLREQVELSSIDKISAAWKKSYDAQVEAEKYLTALKLQNISAVSLAENDTLDRKLRGYSSSALAIAGLAQTERQAAIQKLASDIGTASFVQGISQGLSPADAAAGARYASQAAYNYYIQITAGIGDPEAIARQVEDILNQSSYRGTSTNRGSGVYIA